MTPNYHNHETFESRLLNAYAHFNIEQLAYDLGLYQRKFRKVSPVTFVFGLCRGTFNTFASANIIAGTIASITGKFISKQALLK